VLKDEPDALPAPAAPSDVLRLLQRVEGRPSTVENGRQVRTGSRGSEFGVRLQDFRSG